MTKCPSAVLVYRQTFDASAGPFRAGRNGATARSRTVSSAAVADSAAIPAWNAGRILPSGYKVAAVDIRSNAETSNTAAVGIYRGAGRPEANCLMERLVDAAAAATGIDPLEIRRRNW